MGCQPPVTWCTSSERGRGQAYWFVPPTHTHTQKERVWRERSDYESCKSLSLTARITDLSFWPSGSQLLHAFTAFFISLRDIQDTKHCDTVLQYSFQSFLKTLNWFIRLKTHWINVMNQTILFVWMSFVHFSAICFCDYLEVFNIYMI